MRLYGRTLSLTDNPNFSFFSSERYNRRIAQATTMTGQARYRAFGALDVDLMRNVAPIAPFMHDNSRRYFLSPPPQLLRAPVYGLDLSAIAVE